MKTQYHHGNLKMALVEQAIDLLEREGLASLSLRQVAKQTGVSQAAPYGHFKDKRALLTAVANEGYRQFHQRMEEEAATNPDQYLLGLGRGYVLYALENPSLFHLMFSGELASLIDVSELDEAIDKCHQLLVVGVAQSSSKLSSNPMDVPLSWSIVHGLASLLLAKAMSPEDYGTKNTHDFINSVLSRNLA